MKIRIDLQGKSGFRLIISVLLMVASDHCAAQVINKIHGVVFDSGSGTRLKNVAIYNQSTKVGLNADSSGDFTIDAAKTDTLVVELSGYLTNKFIPGETTDIKVFLSRIKNLGEVRIQGKSVKVAMKELEESYHDKGIFFKGRPPLYLLSPINGKPITFFYELFSKDGKRARRLQKYAKGEIKNAEISSRFNDSVIRAVIPDITDEVLEQFKAAYWPKIEQIKVWSDFDLYSYIKKSFKQFKGK
jgi:hypothetical protein